MSYLPNHHLEPVLPEKPFSALTPAEVKLVLATMGRAAYERDYQLLQQAKLAMRKSPAPDPALREQLLASFNKHHSKASAKSGLVHRLLAYRIPAWQAAAAVLVLLSSFFLFKEQGFPGMKTEKVYVYLTDTVYKEVSLPAIDSALNAPLNRINVKPGGDQLSIMGFSDTIAAIDSAGNRPNYLNAGDSLPGPYPESYKPGINYSQHPKRLWHIWGEVN